MSGVDNQDTGYLLHIPGGTTLVESRKDLGFAVHALVVNDDGTVVAAGESQNHPYVLKTAVPFVDGKDVSFDVSALSSGVNLGVVHASARDQFGRILIAGSHDGVGPQTGTVYVARFWP